MKELTLRAGDGVPLHVADWPIDAPRGGIVLMHGLGEHSGRYVHVARFFNEQGWSVRAYDHRGHGRSGGARGDVPDDEAILRDAKTVFDDFARQFPSPPMLLGHSMGGLFAARFATGRLAPISGLILSSPALAIPLSPAQKILLGIMAVLAPGLAVANGLQTGFLSHDPAVEPAYLNDPLVHGKISARLLRSMLAAVKFVQSHADALTVPTLMVMAGEDRLVDARGSREFFPKLAPDLATLHVYQHLYHELFNEREPDRGQVFADVRSWLESIR